MAGTFLRKRKQEASSKEHSGEGHVLLPNKGLPPDDSLKVVPEWAESILCGSKATKWACMGGECELLHLPTSSLERHCRPPQGGKGKVVVCAGPERSGSTWLFNAARLLLQVRHGRLT
jgi:hypothetical protein